MNKVTITYCVLCLVLWVALGAGVLCLDKSFLHLALQLSHTSLSDVFFKYYSSFAEWLLYILMLLPLCFKRWRETLVFGVAEGLTAAVVQIIKHTCNMPRPVTWFTEQFGNADMLPLVEGVKMNLQHSFPSGHTATFFAFFTVAVFLLSESQEKREERGDRGAGSVWQVVLGMACFVLAATGGYSRIYLSQHFATDVLVGSIIGTIMATVVVYGYNAVRLRHK